MKKEKNVVMYKQNEGLKHYILKGKRLFLMLAVIWYMFTNAGSSFVYAAEEVEITETQDAAVIELSQIMVAVREVEMKAEPNFNSETLMTYDKDALVFVTGIVEDEWYRVTYQDKNGYVDKTALIMQEIDVAGLDAEMAVEAEETKFVLEEVERYREESKRSKIWGTVIVLLVIAIFATGIVSTIRAGKNKQEDEKKDGKTENGIETADNSSLNIEDLDKESEEE